jgi:hypothetical protein
MIWEEAVVAHWRHGPGIRLEALRKATKTSIRIVDVSAEIGIQVSSLTGRATLLGNAVLWKTRHLVWGTY